MNIKNERSRASDLLVKKDLGHFYYVSRHYSTSDQRIHNQCEEAIEGEEGAIVHLPTPLLHSSYAPGRGQQRIV